MVGLILGKKNGFTAAIKKGPGLEAGIVELRNGRNPGPGDFDLGHGILSVRRQTLESGRFWSRTPVGRYSGNRKSVFRDFFCCIPDDYMPKYNHLRTTPALSTDRASSKSGGPNAW